ncbi:MAG: ABC transporter substrate-binding protein, partial [Roseiflexaceae bacterium]
MASNDKALSRRRFLRYAAAGLGVAGAAGVLAACGGAAAPAEDAAAPAEGNKVVVELDFWYWDGSGQLWADAYNKLNRGAKVNFINTPFADTHDKLLTSF